MSQTVQKTWEQEMLERGKAEGEAKGRAEGKVEGQVEACREDLCLILEERFGPLPELAAQRIEAINDLERLRGLFCQALRVSSLAELKW